MVLRQWRGARDNNGEERNGLSGAIAIGSTQQRKLEYDKEAEDKNRGRPVYVCAGWTCRGAQQEKYNAKQSDNCAPDREVPHGSMLPQDIPQFGREGRSGARTHLRGHVRSDMISYVM
jgi:hypothetical protein